MNNISLPKENYNKIQNLVWYVLKVSKVKKLPIDLIKICEDFNITVRAYDKDHILAKYYKSGFSYVTKDNKKFIFFNDSEKNICRIRFTIAHELGHILLNHSKNTNNISYSQMETEVNMFAIRLLSPLCILKELNIQSVNELCRYCNISKTAGKNRFKRFQEALKKDKFYTNPNEKLILNQFKDFIDQQSKKYN